MLDTPFALGLVCAITLLSRCGFRLFICSRVRSSDTLTHLKCVRLVKDVGWREAARRFKPDYPLGYHKLLSVLPVRFLGQWEMINGGVFDSLHVLLFAGVLSCIGSRPLSPTIVWLWAPLLLALYPGWTHFGFGPRAYYGTERVFSDLLTSAVFSSLWFSAAGGASAWLWYFLAVLLGGCLLNVSKFGAQVLVGFSILIAIGTRYWALAAIPLLAFCAALAFSRGTYWNVLRGHWKYLRWYAGVRDMWAVQRNSLGMLRSLVKEKGWPHALIAYLFVHNSWSVGLLGNVPLGMALALGASGVGKLPPAGFAWDWLAAGAVLWCLTSLRPLRFVGEGERYLVCAAVPSYYLIAQWLVTAPAYARWLLLLYSVAWFGCQQIILWSLSREHEPTPGALKHQQDLIDFLRGLPKRRVLTFGSSLFQAQIAYSTHPQPHWLFDPRVNTTVTWKQIFSVYPLPKWNAVRLLDIELIATEKASVKQVNRVSASEEFPFDSLHKLFENEDYVVYQVANQSK